jgi:cation:H+ antiporter
VLFLIGGLAVSAAVTLLASWVLVGRIEHMGGRLGVTEAMLGLIAALAADAPEITAAISALIGHQPDVGAGVTVGSNVFNLAALLGLGALAAGWVALHRRVILLTGAIAMYIAAVCTLTVLHWLPAVAGLLLVLAALGPYVVLAGSRRGRTRAGRWLNVALREEEAELHPALEPFSVRYALVQAVLALVVVVGASVVMEHLAINLGRRDGVSDIVVGGVLLAGVTSLPNAVAAIYLARRGRGTAMLSTALNSNALNVAVGLLLPASVLGLGSVSRSQIVLTLWYLGLTAVVLVLAYHDRGLRRQTGMVVLVAYVLFVASLALAAHRSPGPLVLAAPAMVIAVWTLLLLARPPQRPVSRAAIRS